MDSREARRAERAKIFSNPDEMEKRTAQLEAQKTSAGDPDGLLQYAINKGREHITKLRADTPKE